MVEHALFLIYILRKQSKTKHNKTLHCEDEKGYQTSSKLQGSWVFSFSDCGIAILDFMYSMNLSDQLKGEIEKFLNTLMPKECVEMTQTYDSSIFPSKLINVMFLPHNMIFIPAASTIGDRIFFYHFGLSRSEFENPTFRS